MKSELMQEFYDEKERDTKAEITESLCVLLDNAVGYMLEDQRSQEEIAEYLGTTTEILDAVHNEDYEEIHRLLNKKE